MAEIDTNKNTITDKGFADIEKRIEDDLVNKNFELMTSNAKEDGKQQEYYMDCAPVGHSSDEITTYNVPINSEYTRDSARMDIYKTLVNLCLVIIFMILTYFTVPHIYKYGIVDVINKMFQGSSDADNEQRIHRITTVDIVLSLWMIGIILFFLALSFSVGLWASYAFVILLIVYILSVVIIDGKKKESSFMTTILPGDKNIETVYKINDDDKIDYFKNVSPFDIVNFVKDGVGYMCGLPFPFVIWFGILLFYYIAILVSHYIFDIFTDDQFKTYSWTFPIFIMLPSILFFCLLFDVGTAYQKSRVKAA